MPQMTIAEVEEKLRLKIAQARRNGFDVVPYFGDGNRRMYELGAGAVSVKDRCCCIVGAASDLAANHSTDPVGWLPYGWQEDIEDGFELYSINKTRNSWILLGRRLRRECLDYYARKRRRVSK